jgi:predicted RNA-binding protein YlxR (DUF448 family)
VNRQQRRKMQRRGIYVDRETMTAATATGHQFRIPELIADPPAKVQGRHRWILSSAYNVTEAEAHQAHEGASTVLMGPEKLISFGVGCWDCEQTYKDAVAEPCPGDPSGAAS